MHYLVNHSAEKQQSSTNNLIAAEEEDGKELERKVEDMRKGTISQSSSVKFLHKD